MAFSTRRVPSYSSCQSQPSTASLSIRYNLKMGAFHWAILSVFRSDKQNCFVSIIIHYLCTLPCSISEVCQDLYITLQYIRGVSGPVHCPAVHQRCVRTCTLPCSTSGVCQDLYIALQYIRGVSGPVTVWHSDDYLCRHEKQELDSWKPYSCSAGFKQSVAH